MAPRRFCHFPTAGMSRVPIPSSSPHPPPPPTIPHRTTAGRELTRRSMIYELAGSNLSRPPPLSLTLSLVSLTLSISRLSRAADDTVHAANTAAIRTRSRSSSLHPRQRTRVRKPARARAHPPCRRMSLVSIPLLTARPSHRIGPRSR
jgi:hypothetical protein